MMQLDPTILYKLGLALIVAGLFIILAAFLSLFLKARRKGKTEGAGIIIIGFFPIVFGTDKKSVTIVLLLSIILLIVITIFYLMWR
jgi:uncharacterized protein (TIGR00304 family)